MQIISEEVLWSMALSSQARGSSKKGLNIDSKAIPSAEKGMCSIYIWKLIFWAYEFKLHLNGRL